MIFIEWLSSYRKCKSSEPSCFTLYQRSFEDVHLEAKSIEFHMPHCIVDRALVLYNELAQHIRFEFWALPRLYGSGSFAEKP